MRRHLRTLLIVFAVGIIFAAGFMVGTTIPSARAADPAQGLSGNSSLQRIDAIWTLLHREFLEQPIDDEVLIQGAIDGMLETLKDKHTSYMPPSEFEMLNESFSGSYSGIGALVEAEGDRLLIVSPFDDSPAAAAGLQPGDEIVRVDDTLISEFEDPLAAITLVRGPEGKPVTLLMRRDGREFEVTIVRATIPLISASGEMREDGIGYVRVADFGQTTTEQLRETLTGILASDPKGLVLDLRGNPGGSLDAAIEVTSEFIGDGTVMLEEWGNGDRESYEAEPGGLATDPELPLIVLIDGGSASASEIVAGAIQDRERGQLLGETTYGKGTVQNWHDLGAGNGGVRVTIARWLTPEGTWVHEQGLEPDIEVRLTDADLEAERDIQLETAVSLLLGQPVPEPEPPSEEDIWRCCTYSGER